MSSELLDFSDTITPTEADARLAEESSRRLMRLLCRPDGNLQLRVQADNEPEESIAIPASAFRLLNHILTEMAKRNAVALMPVYSELTTQQAADIVNVSRPFLIRLVEEGKLPCRMVGTDRRIQLQDLLQYKRHTHQERLKVLEELAAQAQELGMGY